jgi:hypothetical protein
MSETRAAEANQLKRKSLGASPDAEADENQDTPNKRQKVNDGLGTGPERHGSGTNGDGYGERRRSSVKDGSLKEESLSPDARRQRQAGDIPSSPDEERRRRPYQSSRHDDRSPRSPPDRRGSDRRGSDGRGPERRGSETSRRMSSSHGPGPESLRERRESYSQEEKKRGRRLFGGLLSTLSQTTTNSHQKRRLEIEKKQQEKAVKQKSVDDKRRAEKLARLDKVRRIEQVRFDEQVVSLSDDPSHPPNLAVHAAFFFLPTVDANTKGTIY